MGPTPGLQGEVQTHNASLAVALASHFLYVHNNPDHHHSPPVVHHPDQLLPELKPLHLSQAVSRGLEKTRWPVWTGSERPALWRTRSRCSGCCCSMPQETGMS